MSCRKKHSTFNIQRPTLNGHCARHNSALNVECWVCFVEKIESRLGSTRVGWERIRLATLCRLVAKRRPTIARRFNAGWRFAVAKVPEGRLNVSSEDRKIAIGKLWPGGNKSVLNATKGSHRNGFQPSLRDSLRRNAYPALKRRAIVRCPYGTTLQSSRFGELQRRDLDRAGWVLNVFEILDPGGCR